MSLVKLEAALKSVVSRYHRENDEVTETVKVWLIGLFCTTELYGEDCVDLLTEFCEHGTLSMPEAFRHSRCTASGLL